MSSGVMTIETGVSCNNNCIYCPQRALRKARDQGPDQGTASLKERVLKAREQGYSEIAFSGGEPTIRRDLKDVISFARSVGFVKVGVTTNGRLFAYEGFAREAVSAGLTGVSFSLHGPDAATHDRLVGVEGAFDQLVAGIRSVGRVREETGGVPDTHTITMVVPSNVESLPDTLRLAGELGIRLHIVQPFIVSREVLDHASEFLLPLERIVAAIEAAAETVREHGGRIKPYNVAPCLLEHLGPVIELQERPLRTFRSFVPSPDTPEGRVAKGQFVRVDACLTCEHLCPGFRLEQMSGSAMADEMMDALNRFPGGEGSPGTFTLDGLDLLDTGNLRRVIAGVRELADGRLRLLYGGISMSPHPEFIRAAAGGGVDEICLVAIPPMLRMPEGRMWQAGNVGRLFEVMEGFDDGAGTELALFMVPGMALAPEFDFDKGDCMRLIEGLSTAGGKTLYIALPDRLDAHLPPFDDGFRDRLSSFLGQLVPGAADFGLETRVVRVPGGPRLDLSDMAEGMARVEDWTRGFLAHPFTGPGFGWVHWSHPGWVLDHVEETR